MERPIYPSKFMRITQGFGEGTHKGSFAIDDAGKDTGIDNLYAPFTGMIKKIYQSDANEIWFESIERVEYPDGTIDYMNILMAHSNDIADLYIGKVIKQGDLIYHEGTKGQATGNHCHLECGLGKFSGSGWYKNSYNNWVIKNGKDPTECLFIDDSITILDNYGYTFKKINSLEEEIEELVVDDDNEKKEEIVDETVEILDIADNSNKVVDDIYSDISLIFTCKRDDMYAIELKEGQNLYLKNKP